MPPGERLASGRRGCTKIGMNSNSGTLHLSMVETSCVETVATCLHPTLMGSLCNDPATKARGNILQFCEFQIGSRFKD